MDKSAEPHLDSTTQPTFTRREALAIAAAALLPVQPRPPAPKKIIVAGAGIGGLSCAWELVRRGHDVSVIEASERTGGHVKTFRDGLDDALYADAGAEHFTQPGYERYWGYVREFNLAHVYYPRREHLLRWIGGQMYTPEMLADRKVLETLGLNRREADYLGQHPFPELASLYFAPYVDSFTDEYRPFDAGLNELDKVSTTELFRKDGASAAALGFIGGSGSALQAVWHAAILKLRGVPLFPPRVYRLVGGNQTLTDTFAQRLGERVRLRSPVTEIEHGETGVRVSYRDDKETSRIEADYLVCAMSARMLRLLPVKPAWPANKTFAIANVPYYHDTRVIFQTRTASGIATASARTWILARPRSTQYGPHRRKSRRAVDCWRGQRRVPARLTGHSRRIESSIRANPRTSSARTWSCGLSIPGRRRASARPTRRGSWRCSGPS